MIIKHFKIAYAGIRDADQVVECWLCMDEALGSSSSTKTIMLKIYIKRKERRIFL